MADAGESLVIRQVRYAIKKSAKLLGDNVFIGLASGRGRCDSIQTFNIDERSVQKPYTDFFPRILIRIRCTKALITGASQLSPSNINHTP